MGTVVDADTHILESPDIWELMDPEVYARRPLLLSVPLDTQFGNRNAFWLVDGNITPKPLPGKGAHILHTPSTQAIERGRIDSSVGSRELTDLDARLADMDRLSVDVQVIYPTLFLRYLTDDVELEIAMCKAYNRWMARVWAGAKGRLRWVAVLPLQHIDASLIQLQEAKDNGAVGVFFRGLEGDRTVDDPYFYPIFEAASALNMPICIHTGNGNPTLANFFDFKHLNTIPLPLKAFIDLVRNKTPERFPDLRFGFIEAGSAWVPYVLGMVRRPNAAQRIAAQQRPAVDQELSSRSSTEWGQALFRDYRFYVACLVDEDLSYVLRYTGEDNLLIGSDYAHLDPSFQGGMVNALRSREDVPSRVAEKILSANPKAFYGL